MFNPMSLEGKRILITGASSGIGAACAKVASKLGAFVCMVARNADKLASVQSSLESPARSCIIPLDLTNFTQEQFVEMGKFDGFVHAAGISPMIPVRFTTEEKIMQVMKVNYFAFVALMGLLAQPKFHNKPFSAVAISSTSALCGVSGGTAYCGSKGALSSSVRALAVELAKKSIRVNTVCPSMVRTPMFEKGVLGGAACDEGTLARIEARQLLGIGSPEQIANAVCFLLSDAASFITGTDLLVDGGKLA